MPMVDAKGQEKRRPESRLMILRTKSQSSKSGDCVLPRSEAFRVSDGDIDRLQRSDASRALGEVGIIRELDALVGLQAQPQQRP